MASDLSIGQSYPLLEQPVPYDYIGNLNSRMDQVLFSIVTIKTHLFTRNQKEYKVRNFTWKGSEFEPKNPTVKSG